MQALLFLCNSYKDNTKLMAQATGQGAFPLTAIRKDTFEFRAAGITLIQLQIK
jgi:hypothetical protein